MRLVRLSFTALMMMAVGCSCEDETVIPIQICDLRTECGDSEALRHGSCIRERCASDEDCCAGQRCSGSGKCSPIEDRCSSDEDCSEAGFFCIEEGGRARCLRPRCETTADCALGSCFERRCVVEPPCLEDCEAGTFCDVQSNRCLPVPRGASGCDQKCGLGQRLMLEDTQTMRGDICCEATCVCRDLPDIAPRDIGLYLDAQAEEETIAVAAYERHFGDLVFMRLGSNGSIQLLEFVDGFPQAESVAGRVDGPRGGALEAGLDVGRYPSLALFEGEPQVAYQRADDGALMFAWRRQGAWTKVTVDAGGGTGFEPDLVIDAQGRPHIAYRTRLSNGQTALRYAVADRSKPDHPNHFVLVSVVAVDSCIDGCADGQTCVRDDAGERCLADAQGCSPCAGGTICVQADEPVCRAPAHRAGEVSERLVGRAPELLLRPDGAVIVFGDTQQGTLRVAQVVGGRTAGVFTIDGDGAGEDRADGTLGRSLAAAYNAQGQLVIFYRDEETQAIRRYIGAIDGQGEHTVVDTGRTQSDERGGLDRVQGSDLSLVIEADQELVVFQDQSMGDVSALIAGERRLVRSQLLDGFSARLVRLGGQPLAVHGAVRTDRDGVSRFGVVVVGLQ